LHHQIQHLVTKPEASIQKVLSKRDAKQKSQKWSKQVRRRDDVQFAIEINFIPCFYNLSDGGSAGEKGREELAFL
jgi:hypothetical protein